MFPTQNESVFNKNPYTTLNVIFHAVFHSFHDRRFIPDFAATGPIIACGPAKQAKLTSNRRRVTI